MIRMTVLARSHQFTRLTVGPSDFLAALRTMVLSCGRALGRRCASQSTSSSPPSSPSHHLRRLLGKRSSAVAQSRALIPLQFEASTMHRPERLDGTRRHGRTYPKALPLTRVAAVLSALLTALFPANSRRCSACLRVSSVLTRCFIRRSNVVFDNPCRQQYSDRFNPLQRYASSPRQTPTQPPADGLFVGRSAQRSSP